MPKIVLVSPPLSKKARYGRLADAGMYMPAHGLGYLAAFVKKSGYDAAILDCEALGLDVEKASLQITALKPDYVGISAVTMSIFSAAELAASLKKSVPDLRIIVGGVHLSAAPEETLDLYPQFDFGVIGEGEETLRELLDSLRDKKDPDAVRGIIYRRKGKALRTLHRPVMKDIDKLPFPAWDLYPDITQHYHPSSFGFKQLPCTSLITSRGCPYPCSFCSRPQASDRICREHSAGYVMEMIRVLYHNYAIRDIIIYDDTFGINRKRLVDFCEMLIKERLKLSWSCNLRVGAVDTDILRLMKTAGCWQVAYGIESGSQAILDFLQKNITLEMIKDTLVKTRKSGIVAKGYIMVGTPLETTRTIKETLDFVLQADLDLITVNSFTPMPGSLDYERSGQYGIFYQDWRLLNQHNYVFIPRGLELGDLNRAVREITRRFYLRPRVFTKYLKFCLNPRSFKLLFIGMLSLLRFIFLNSPDKLPQDKLNYPEAQ